MNNDINDIIVSEIKIIDEIDALKRAYPSIDTDPNVETAMENKINSLVLKPCWSCKKGHAMDCYHGCKEYTAYADYSLSLEREELTAIKRAVKRLNHEEMQRGGLPLSEGEN